MEENNLESLELQWTNSEMILKKETRILWPFYLEAFLGTALFVMIPFNALYFISIGLSAFQIGILFAFWPLASVLFEIPTSAISDLYGRKRSVLLGWFLTGLFLFLIYFFNSFFSIALLLFLAGISYTLLSGSYDSWVVDLLKKKRIEKSIKNYFVYRQSLINLGMMFSGVIGALFVGAFGLKIIWILSGISLFASGAFCYFGEEIFTRKYSLHYFKDLKKQIKSSFSYSFNHPVLFYVFLIAAISGICLSFDGLISWTQILKSEGLKDSYFGYLWAISAFLGVIAPLIAKKIVKENKEKSFLISLAILTFFYSLLVLISGSLGVLMLLYLVSLFILDLKMPISSTYTHRFIPSRTRATVISMESILVSIATIISFPLAGLLIDNFGGKSAILVAGVLMIPVAFFYLKIREN